MSQSTDDLSRSELRAIRGHYSCTTSPGARRWSAQRGGSPSRGQPRLPAMAAGIEAWKEFCDVSVACNTTALSSR
jgi:hypothetical protein